MSACTFFGHKTCPFSLQESLIKEIENLIFSFDVTTFYVGNNGDFDYLVQLTLIKMERCYPFISWSVVLSNIDEHTISDSQDRSVFSEELACSPKRLRIYKRNEYMLKRSSYVISYLRSNFSNTEKWVNKALDKGAFVISL